DRRGGDADRGRHLHLHERPLYGRVGGRGGGGRGGRRRRGVCGRRTGRGHLAGERAVGRRRRRGRRGRGHRRGRGRDDRRRGRWRGGEGLMAEAARRADKSGPTSRSGAEQTLNRLQMENLTPAQIVAELDRYVIGQNDAKRAVAVALRNRYRRQLLPEELRQEIQPKNILMIGPTGVGKTEIARRVAKIVDAPFLKVEATKFTEVGYVGR